MKENKWVSDQGLLIQDYIIYSIANQGSRAKRGVLITDILRVFEDYEYIEELSQKFGLIKDMLRKPSSVQGLL